MNIIEPIVTREEFDSLSGPMPSYADVDRLFHFFATSTLGDFRITVSSAIIEGFGKVSDYSAVVVARFYVNGDLHLQDAAGGVVNVSKLISDIRGLL